MIDINTYFDKIFYINLDEDVERNENIISQLEKYNIYNYERISATKFSNIPEQHLWRNFNLDKLNEKYILGSLGCRNSHFRIMETSLKRNYKRIMVLEDDVIIHQDPNQTLNNNQNILDNWDMIYFGGMEEHHFNGQIVGSYAYAINRKLIEETYCMLPTSGMELDNFYAKIIYHISYNYSPTGKYMIHKTKPFNTINHNNNYKSNINKP
jgi:GR25 family glycosyltransferase involved in LPS biosynthesis